MTASEEKYWMENYPKEAETIITLCELFDELGNDDASKAQLDYVIGLLRRKEEGRLIELPVPIGMEFYEVMKGLFGDWIIASAHIQTWTTVRDINDFMEKWGKTVFATRKEAEAKLKELNEKK